MMKLSVLIEARESSETAVLTTSDLFQSAVHSAGITDLCSFNDHKR